jgi:hypothetical protein
MIAMKPPSQTLSVLKAEYDRLRRSLAKVGYVSGGSVQERRVRTSGRSGLQWTRKVAGKTVSVALSPAQYEALKQAVTNQRALWQTIRQMERISRRIIFASTPDTSRRKRLSKKVLGTN